jgi:hypothetical protein
VGEALALLHERPAGGDLLEVLHREVGRGLRLCRGHY